MNVAMYLRKSRAEEQSDSLQEVVSRHKDILSEFARQKKLNIVDTYEEVVSGESLYARPQMLRLLEQIDADQYDAVLCMDIDRLGRGGMHDQGIILDSFKYSGTKIITPDKTYDLNDDTDEELTEFKTFMSRRELKIINKRLQRGLIQTIKGGGYVSNAPYGYRQTRKDKIPTLEVIQEEAEFVRMIFDMYVNQGVGCLTIAQTISALGAKPRRSEVFSRNTIRKILLNETYIGKTRWDQKNTVKRNKNGQTVSQIVNNPKEQWILIDGLHEPIIDEKTFQMAGAIMQSRYIPPSNTGEVKSALAGVVKCGKCGHNMQRMGENTGVPTLRCVYAGCCAGAKFEYVEEAILSHLKDSLDKIKVEIEKDRTIDATNIRSMLKLTESEIASLKKQREKVHNLLEQEVYDVATYTERITDINARLEDTLSQHEAQQKELDRITQLNQSQFPKIIESVLRTYEKSDTKTKNKLLKEVIEEAIYYKEKKTKPREFTLILKLKNISIS